MSRSSKRIIIKIRRHYVTMMRAPPGARPRHRPPLSRRSARWPVASPPWFPTAHLFAGSVAVGRAPFGRPRSALLEERVPLAGVRHKRASRRATAPRYRSARDGRRGRLPHRSRGLETGGHRLRAESPWPSPAETARPRSAAAARRAERSPGARASSTTRIDQTPQRCSTFRLISFELGGFSPRPRLWSISWMKAF